MKKVILVFIVLLTAGCVKVVATGSDVVGKTTRLNREMIQVKSDLALQEQLQDSISKGKEQLPYRTRFGNIDGRYYIDVMEGRVLLTGIVKDTNTKAYIIDKIMENQDVRELLDELKVDSVKNKTVSDFFLKRSIIAKIFFKSKIRSLNYEISVVNGYVYTIGIAQDKDEADLIGKLIGTVRGVKEVNSYIITVDNKKKLKVNFTN